MNIILNRVVKYFGFYVGQGFSLANANLLQYFKYSVLLLAVFLNLFVVQYSYAETIGNVDHVLVSNKEDLAKISVSISQITSYKHLILENPLRIVLDIQNAMDSLIAKAKDISLKIGPVQSVQTMQFAMEPVKIVRVILNIRETEINNKEALSYKVDNESNEIVISVTKVNSATIGQASRLSISEISEETKVSSVEETIGSSGVEKSKEKAVVSPENEYIVDIGDLLNIAVYPGEEFNKETVVNTDGKITMLMVGDILAKGRKVSELTEDITKRISKYVSSPKVSVSVRKFGYRKIYLTGEVRASGAYDFRDGQKLTEFVTGSGGFTAKADLKNVKIYRGEPDKREIINVNVEEMMKNGDFKKDIILQTGDIIDVPKGVKEVFIIGQVKSTGTYEHRVGLKMLELISKAGGFTDIADISSIRVFRGLEEKKEVLEVDMAKVMKDGQLDKDIFLQPGDIIFVPSGSITTWNWIISSIVPTMSFIVSLVTLIYIVK
ncbi:MAG: SLBB domain-containing protein [Candidatus Firestonebacteria bacterium]